MPGLQEYFPPHSLLDGRYLIGEELGTGGFATVFSARDEQTGRRVAIKILNTLGMDSGEGLDAFLKRFEREAQLAARIQHANIINILNYGTARAVQAPYIVMERLEGMDLERALKEDGPMTAARLFPMFCDALDALGMAHDEGIVHKDLKPSNLFLRHPGERFESLCVVDFGTAYLQDITTRLTRVGSVVGTPNYVAPEYATDQIVTPALDVYQMGLILVELLTGRPVVKAPDSLIAMFQHVNGNLKVPRPLLRSPLGPVLRHALARDPKERYGHAFGFSSALRRVNPAEVPIIGADDEWVLLHSDDALEEDSAEHVVPTFSTGELSMGKETGEAGMVPGAFATGATPALDVPVPGEVLSLEMTPSEAEEVEAMELDLPPAASAHPAAPELDSAPRMGQAVRTRTTHRASIPTPLMNTPMTPITAEDVARVTGRTPAVASTSSHSGLIVRPEAAAPPSGNRQILLAVLVGVPCIAGLTVLALWGLGMLGQPPAVVITDGPSTTGVTSGATTGAPKAAPAPVGVKLQIRSTPSGARVLADPDGLLGYTPIDRVLAPGVKPPQKLIFSAPRRGNVELTVPAPRDGVILISATLPAADTAADDPRTPEERFAQAEERFKAGDFKAATALCDGLGDAQKFSRCHLFAAMDHRKQGAHQAACVSLDRYTKDAGAALSDDAKQSARALRASMKCP